MMRASAYIVRVARTASGKRNGRISHLHPAALGAVSVDAALTRVSEFDYSLVDDVIFGCVTQVGSQGLNLGRNVVLNSTILPISVPGTSVDRQCGSSQQAIHFAAQAVMSGTQDIIVAGGVESMSMVPLFSSVPKRGPFGDPNSEGVKQRFGNAPFFSQFIGAEMMCSQYEITREEMDEFAAGSHAKAATAQENGHFVREIVGVEGKEKDGSTVMHDSDEGVRPLTTIAKLAHLETLVEQGFCPPPVDAPAGRITAGNASQIADGSAAILIANEQGLRKMGNPLPLARIHSLAIAASDPVLMLQAPIPATTKVLERARLSISDVDLYEVNEAFACIPMAWAKALGADPIKLNVNGGACALGHPLGGTGAKLMATLVSEMVRTKARLGLQAICEGGGTANATIVELC
mmetsp:Transcript_61198/g.101828  ORF Transcript_61198/g.101828 Transcript_61198/m.101828 type:complete len:406 (-) Transcript_61198:95-1312(-)|eukprot:CAMPEP_0119312006 /NCGR_PEP_ID=MMETSP1333-20130426/24710_1 /TAXON_ID=418940 /ORGANISM="Scyphosphaera apsteinii, Strain RCC1455" /LENGTH=405 /DNA_ID=CAMNT_0007316539 /DNA_START=28 /DNA_END=1245 /DNA_ORIENTATION=-